MKLFGQIVRTTVNIAIVPLAVAKDVVTLGGVVTGDTDPGLHTTKQAIQKLKDEASDD